MSTHPTSLAQDLVPRRRDAEHKQTEPWSGHLIFASIAQELREVDEILHAELHSQQAFVNRLVDHSTQWRGKRLRPALVLLSGKACGEINPAHKVLAAVVEMIHTATLVHDDVLDDAVLRRHLATVNVRWGNETSVLLGDYFFTHAFHLASSLESTFACRVIGRATNIVCEGELRQIHERGNLALTEADYLEIISAKTAELCACSCRLGAYYAGAPEPIQQALESYGRKLGIAFQIIDDLLDVAGDEQEAGKSLGTDLEKQKLTLPLIRLLGQASPQDAEQIRNLLSNTENHQRRALEPFLESADALAYAHHRAVEFADSARQEIGGLPDSEAKTLLAKLTRLVVNRRN